MATTPKSRHETFLKSVTETAKAKDFYGKELLIDRFKDKENLSREELMCIDIMMGNTQNVRQYLQMGADANYKVKNKSLLDLAAAYGHHDIVKVLKEFGAKQTLSKRPKI